MPLHEIAAITQHIELLIGCTLEISTACFFSLCISDDLGGICIVTMDVRGNDGLAYDTDVAELIGLQTALQEDGNTLETTLPEVEGTGFGGNQFGRAETISLRNK
jgi:hypothetical protein